MRVATYPSSDEKASGEALSPFARRLFATLMSMLRAEVTESAFLPESRAAPLLKALDSEEAWAERIGGELAAASPPASPDEDGDKGDPAIVVRTDLSESDSLVDAERLLERLADAIARTLARECGLALDLASYLVVEACRKALGHFLDAADQQRLLDYFEELKRHGRLTSDVLLEHARRGDSPVFFAAIAVAVDLDLDAEMVEAFIEDGGVEVLERLLLRADLVEAARQTIVATYADAVRNGHASG